MEQWDEMVLQLKEKVGHWTSLESNVQRFKQHARIWKALIEENPVRADVLFESVCEERAFLLGCIEIMLDLDLISAENWRTLYEELWEETRI